MAGDTGDEDSEVSSDGGDGDGGHDLRTDDFRTIRIVHDRDDVSAADESGGDVGANVVGIGFTLVGGNAKGVFVDAVDPGSAAARAGLRRGDQVLAVDGRHIFGRTRDEVHLANVIVTVHHGRVKR